MTYLTISRLPVELCRKALKNSFRRIRKVTLLDTTKITLPEGCKSTPVTCRRVAGTRRIAKDSLKGTTMSSSGNQGLGTKAAKASVSELESMLSESPSSDRVCLKLAQIAARAPQRSGTAQVRKGKSAIYLSAGTAIGGRTAADADRRLQPGLQRLALHFCRIPSCA